MNHRIALPSLPYFSYSQFMVYDESVRFPGCAWTAEHTAQGFARRQSTVNFGTLLEFGYADVAIVRSAFQAQKEYERIIAVPFLVTSGMVIVEGPEETETERNIRLPPGNYRLIAAQSVTGDEEESIDLSFELLVKPLEQRCVLVADKALRVPNRLVETAEVDGET